MGGTTIKTSEKRINALQLQKSSYGLPLPIVYGTQRIAGNLIWYGGFKATAITSKTSQGGKGGGVSQQNTTYSYSASLILSLCEGPIVGVNKVWRESTELESSQSTASATLGAIGLDVALGALGQPVWGYLTTKFPTEALAYSGMAYVKGADYQIGGDAGIPNHSFEVQGFCIANNSMDANPADVLADYLPSSRYGPGFPGAQLADLTPMRTYCQAAGLLFSPVFEEQGRAIEHIKKLCELANVAPVWSEGKLKFVPYGDVAITANGATYTPNVTPLYDLTDDDFLGYGQPPVELKRKSSADAKNHVTVEFKNRANQYAVEVAEAKDQASIERDGLRSADVFSAPWITSPVVAQNVAQLLLQRHLYTRNEYGFKLGWKYAALEPMDIVTLTDVGLGLSKTPVRITKVDEDDKGSLQIEAEDFPQGAGHAPQYPTPANLSTLGSADAGNVVQPVVFEVPPEETSTGLALYVAATGNTPYWAGADVWLSLDNTTYTRLGRIEAGARYGSLVNGINASDTTLRVALAGLGGEIGNATANDAALFKSLLWVDGEYMAHANATLAAANTYDLSGLVRAGYGTVAAAHAAGKKVVRIDGAVLRSADLGVEHLGRDVYLKLCSYNTLGGPSERLDAVVAYVYNIAGTLLNVPPPVPTLLMATAQGDGINLTWQRPTWRRKTRTEVQRSVNGTSGWQPLALVDGDGFVDPITDGSTWYYRVRGVDVYGIGSAPGPVVSAKAKTVVDGADVSTVSVQAGLLNPSFEAGDFHWAKQNTWTVVNDPANARRGSWVAKSNAAGDAAITNNARIPVGDGDVVSVTCWAKHVGSNATTRQLRVFAYNASNNIVGGFGSTGVVGTAYSQRRVQAVMPANTAYITVDFAVFGESAGSTYVDDFLFQVLARDLDEVPNGALYGRPLNTRLAGGRPFINLAETENLNRTADYLAETASRRWAGETGATVGARLGSNFRNLAEEVVYGLEEFPDGATRIARPIYNLPSAQAAAQWAKLGTWNSGGQGQTLRLQVESGVGFNSNTRQQSTTSILLRTANDLSAPNLSGITWLTNGRDTITGVKAVATGGSTSATNRSWDVYVQLATFAAGHYSPYLAVQGGGNWLHAIAANQADPGAASSTVVVGLGNQTFDESSNLDFARNLLLNRNADYLAESASRRWASESGATVGARTGVNLRNNSGTLLAQAEIVTSEGTSLDTSNVGGRTSGTVRDESRNGHNLTQPNSGARLGNQRNTGALTIANARSRFSGVALTSSYDSASPAIVTISATSGTLLAGMSPDPSYNASSASVSQARGSTRTYFCYFDDAAFAGGAQTLQLTTNGDLLYTNGRIYVGAVTVNVPASGGGTGGGGSGGGGNGGGVQP